MRLGLFLLFLSLSSFASQIEVRGRSYVMTCGYFSTVEGDVEVQFQDRNLPWGTRVFLVTALSGEELLDREKVDWRERQEIEMKANAAFTWKTSFSKQLHYRSSSIAFTKVVFVFRIESPGQAPLWDNGGTLRGYYQSEIWKPGTAPCVSSAKDKPELKPLVFEIIRKDD